MADSEIWEVTSLKLRLKTALHEIEHLSLYIAHKEKFIPIASDRRKQDAHLWKWQVDYFQSKLANLQKELLEVCNQRDEAVIQRVNSLMQSFKG